MEYQKLRDERLGESSETIRKRVQAVLWAMQDLCLKRERLARHVCVKDPISWLNKVAAKACGYDLHLQVVAALEHQVQAHSGECFSE